MSDQELAQAMRELIARQATGLPDARQLTADVMRLDRGRVRLLAACSIFFWVLAAAGLLFLVFGLDRLVVFIRIRDFPGFIPATPNKTGAAPATSPADAERIRDWQMLHGTEPLHHGLWVVAGAIVSLLLAALFTVLLVFSSRRATLRQINVSLMEISEQLKQLRRPAPT